MRVLRKVYTLLMEVFSPFQTLRTTWPLTPQIPLALLIPLGLLFRHSHGREVRGAKED